MRNNTLEDLMILLCSAGVLIFAVFALDRTADYPVVYVSQATQQCVRVESPGGKLTCADWPRIRQYHEVVVR